MSILRFLVFVFSLLFFWVFIGIIGRTPDKRISEISRALFFVGVLGGGLDSRGGGDLW